MKQLIILAFSTFLFTVAANAQTTDKLLQENQNFTGAVAHQNIYNTIFQLDNNDPNIIGKAIRNINNALKDPRLSGKIHIELVAFASGTDAYLKGSKYEEDLKNLVKKGVVVAQCHNTLVERKISRDSIYNFIGVVPSGVGELIIRQAEGWSIVKP